MSGPKVVRIVTVEEVQATCRRLMAQVEAGGSDLRRLAKRLDLLDGSLEASLAARDRLLKEMFASSQWMELQKLAMDTLAFYPSERARLQDEAATRAEAVRSSRRRLVDGARTIADALKAGGQSVPEELRNVIAGAARANDRSLASMESVLSAALSHVTAPRADAAAAEESSKLAARLAAGEATATLATWLLRRVSPPTASEQRLDRIMAELEILEEIDVTAFSARIASISREESASRRVLLTDSLVLEASALLGEARQRNAAVAKLRTSLACLETSGTAAAVALRDRIVDALATVSAAEATAMASEADQLLEEETKAVAAAARRQAVLGALSTLGYEVRETMEATWARDGRVILRKPGLADYGVEVGAPPDAGRLQVRLVGSDRPSMPRSTQRDADQETIWCAEFDRLRNHLASLGDELVIERALEAGAQAVRTVSLPATTHVEPEVRTARPQLRQLP